MPNTQPFSTEHLELPTADGLTLPGFWYAPPAEQDTKTVVIFLHGNGSSSVFYKKEKMEIFAAELAKVGLHLLAFNNRGSHYVKKLAQIQDGEEQYIQVGTALELIADCVPDIEAAIAHAQDRGMKKIILLGESTGANKILVYNHYRPENPVDAYYCVGGGDDTGLWIQQIGLDSWREFFQTCQEKIAAGQGHHLHSTDIDQGIMSYQSLYDTMNPNGDYNCFPYLEYFRDEKWSTKPLFHYWSEVTKPTLVVYGSEDVYTNATPSKAVEALQKHESSQANTSYQIVKNADHSFHGDEKKEILLLIEWWSQLEK